MKYMWFCILFIFSSMLYAEDAPLLFDTPHSAVNLPEKSTNNAAKKRNGSAIVNTKEGPKKGAIKTSRSRNTNKKSAQKTKKHVKQLIIKSQ